MKKILILFVFLFIQFNCTSTRQVTSSGQLQIKEKPSRIFVFTKDSVLYELCKYNLIGDSILSGSGYQNINDSSNPFEGDIKTENIKYILARKGDFWKSALAVGIIGYIGVTGGSYFADDDKNFRMWETITYPSSGGGSSCPFIYSWDGEKYLLEGEAFGISLSSSLEIKTSHILNSLDSDNSIAKIKLSNERPETHYFNQIEVKAIEVDKGVEVYPDANNQFWQVEKTVAPATANDHSGTNIIQKISYNDNDYWESDLANIKSNSNFEDVIEMEFINEESVKDGLLIIHAVNTNLSQKVFEFLGGYLGDQVLEFYNSLETDPEMISIFKNWVSETSLKAFIWNQNKWEGIGFIYPEANSIPFSKVIPFGFDLLNQDTIKIMLKSLIDVWKIDAVQLGVSKNPEKKIINIPIIAAKDNSQNNVNELIKNADNQYKMLLPSESIGFNFNTTPPSAGKKIVYVLNVQGYLYEWFPEKPTSSGFQFARLNRTEKVNYLKNMLKYKSIFLPPIYSEWINYKYTKKDE